MMYPEDLQEILENEYRLLSAVADAVDVETRRGLFWAIYHLYQSVRTAQELIPVINEFVLACQQKKTAMLDAIKKTKGLHTSI